MIAITLLLAVGLLFVVPFSVRRVGMDPTIERPAVAASLASGGILLIAFTLPTGVFAAALAIPWLAVAFGITAVCGVRALRPRRAAEMPLAIATAFLAVAGVVAVQDRLGWWWPPAIPAVIIRLTVVHFTFAGFALMSSAALAARRGESWAVIGAVALGAGIPLTALGFIGLPGATQIGGTIVATGGLAVATALVRLARELDGPRRWLFAVAGASLTLSMPLAVAYAWGREALQWLDIDTMARLHGTLNALGFAVPAALAWELAETRG